MNICVQYLVGMTAKVLNVQPDPLERRDDVAESVVAAVLRVGLERQGLERKESEGPEAVAHVDEHHAVLFGGRRGRLHFLRCPDDVSLDISSFLTEL